MELLLYCGSQSSAGQGLSILPQKKKDVVTNKLMVLVFACSRFPFFLFLKKFFPDLVASPNQHHLLLISGKSLSS